MDFSFSPQEAAFREEVRSFLRRELPPGWQGPIYLGEAYEREEYWGLFPQMARKLGEKGWLGLTWPREYGGQARSPVEALIFAEEYAYYGGVGMDFSAIKLLAPVLLAFGSEEQKRRHLLPVSRGEVVWCQGFSEPNAGSDLAGLQTRAQEMDGHFLLNGQKIWTSGAHRANWCFVLARTDPQAPKHRGISFLLVNLKSPGVTVKALKNLSGRDGFCEVYFDNVRVPKEELVGEKNQGWRAATALLNSERSGIEWFAAGRHALEEIAAHFSGDPCLRERLAEIAVELEVGRLLAYRVAWMLQVGRTPEAEASIAKVFGSELLRRFSQVGMEVLGLYSQLKEDSPRARLQGEIENFYLESLGRTIAAGTSEIQRNIIALRGLGLPRE